MKIIITTLTLILFVHSVTAQSGPEINPDGIIFPKLPAKPPVLESTKGQVIYNTSEARFQTFDGSAWVDFGSGQSGVPQRIEDGDKDSEIKFGEGFTKFDPDEIIFETDGARTLHIQKTINDDTRISFPTTNMYMGTSSGLRGNTNSVENIGIGLSTLRLNETSDYNIAIGREALEEMPATNRSSTSDGFNIAIGYQALKNVADRKGKNVAVGHEAGESGADQSVLIGHRAGKGLKGIANLVLGTDAAESSGSGSGNVLLGTRSGQDASGGDFNVFVGFESGTNVTSGSNNAYFGTEAGKNNNGSNNVFIGHQSGLDETGASNKLIIGNGHTGSPLQNEALIYGDFNSDYVGIGGELRVDGRSMLMPDNNGTMDEVLRRNTGNRDVAVGDINDNDGDLRFYAGGSEGMILENGGNVGIGVANPVEELDVDGTLWLRKQALSATACNSTSEYGKLAFDQATNKLAVCADVSFPGQPEQPGWFFLH